MPAPTIGDNSGFAITATMMPSAERGGFRHTRYPYQNTRIRRRTDIEVTGTEHNKAVVAEVFSFAT
jgi:hypothetical protein